MKNLLVVSIMLPLLFLSFFALQLFLTTPSVTGKEHAENREYSSLKSASESTEPKILPFLIMKDQEAPDPDMHTDIAKRDGQPKKAKQENGCRREDFIVHTKDLGLSTKFIRPESFNAYQCKGKCSLTPGQTFVNHSLLKAFLQKMTGIKTYREACCVPTKLRPVSFIYYTEKGGTFVMRTYRDMIVEECGCY